MKALNLRKIYERLKKVFTMVDGRRSELNLPQEVGVGKCRSAAKVYNMGIRVWVGEMGWVLNWIKALTRRAH